MDWGLIFLIAFLGLFMSGSFLALAFVFASDIAMSILMCATSVFVLVVFAFLLYVEIKDKFKNGAV
jgi:hypothetical protein